MPGQPAHAASFQGQETHVEVNMQGARNLVNGRCRIHLYVNDYVGVLRRKVAAKMGTTAPQVRMLFSGEPSPAAKSNCIGNRRCCACN